MAQAARSILSLQAATLGERQLSTTTTRIDLELPRGGATLVQVDDEIDAVALVDLCIGLAMPTDGHVRFLGVDWQARGARERLMRRRRIGTVVQTHVWPAHMSILDAVLVARLYHSDRPRDEVIAEATALARLFGLPGLPVGRRETTPHRALVRAACVRGFLGAPDLIVVQDQALEATADLAVPMAQAIAEALDRGATVLWIVESLAAEAARFVAADQVFRLGDHGLVQVRRR